MTPYKHVSLYRVENGKNALFFDDTILASDRACLIGERRIGRENGANIDAQRVVGAAAHALLQISGARAASETNQRRTKEQQRTR